MIRCYDLVEEGMEEMAEHHEKEKQSIGFQKTFILWVWWVFIEQSVVFRCDAMLCCWFVVGLIEEELVEKGREEWQSIMKGERQSIGFQKTFRDNYTLPTRGLPLILCAYMWFKF